MLLLTMFLGAAVLPTFAHIAAENTVIQGVPDAQQLVQQGRNLYEAERFLEAASVLQQASAAFKATGDGLRQAMTLSNLSLAYQELGQWFQAKQAIREAIATLHAESLNLLQTGRNLGTSTERTSFGGASLTQILAQALDVQGRLQLAQGQAEAALITWQQAASTYAQIGDEVGVTHSRINTALAMQAMGLYRQAEKTLTSVHQSLQKEPDSPLKAKGLRSLGNVLRVVGDLEKSRHILQQSKDVAEALSTPQAISYALLGLANTARAQQDIPAAISFYQQAATASTSHFTRIQAQLNQLRLLLEDKQLIAAKTLWPQIQSKIPNLPPSPTAVYARINFAQDLTRLRQLTTTDTPSWQDIAQLLAYSVQEAKNLGDQRATSYALGNLGELYYQTQQWSEAIDLTQQALFVAQTIDTPDIAYLWQWQLGRLQRVQGNIQGAIAAYTEAVNNLKSLRSDLVVINSDVQFSFRDNVEPIYRELVGLLLQAGGTGPSQKDLQKSLYFIESLQVTELENFLQCSLQTARTVQINRDIDPENSTTALIARINQVVQEDPTAALIYPIILKDQVAVILKLPGQEKLLYHLTPIKENVVESKLKHLNENLKKPYFLEEDKTPLQDVYNWIIKPFEGELEQSQVKTLVFVLDGYLRNIPMAALHDGQQYLVQKKYGIALAPSVQLLGLKRFERGQLKALIAGLTQERRELGFAPLPLVRDQIDLVKKVLQDYEILLDGKFTKKTLQDKIKSSFYTVIHLATHGRFSSNLQGTFILTADDSININELEDSLRARDQSRGNAIQLLVLSACQTAAGDNRAILGIAGVAVKSGAHSTIAPLWLADEQSTTLLMGKFYEELVINKRSQAEALHLAQKSFLEVDSKYPAPRHWASFVLVGDWL